MTPATGQGRYQYVWCLARLQRWEDVRRESVRGISLAPAYDVKMLHNAVVAADSMLRRQRESVE